MPALSFLTHSTFLGLNIRTFRHSTFSPCRHYHSNHPHPLSQSKTRTILRALLSPTTASDRLQSLRHQMSLHKLDALIIPSGDPHNSEYVSPCFQRRQYISGFTGSAGTAIVLKDNAYLWTDGRYFIQAQRELVEGLWELQKMGEGVEIEEWLGRVVEDGGRVGIDPLLVGVKGGKKVREALGKKGVNLVEVGENLVDRVWEDRPSLPKGGVRVHPLKYAGVDVKEKLRIVREEMEKKKADALLVSMLDEVAWTLNIRGSDVPHCPVCLAYLLVGKDFVKLFVDQSKVEQSPEAMKHLQEVAVELCPYENVSVDVKTFAGSGGSIWMDDASSSLALSVAAGEKAILEKSPIPRLKAIKNISELNGMKEAHLRDAAAVCTFLHWLENRLKEPQSLSEVEAGDKLEQCRAQQAHFQTTSFDTIAGAGPNGAIIHYRATPEACRNVTDSDMFLLDSGGQYTDGTTDITRTMHFGEPSAWEKNCYTYVLKGHIALDTAVFPEKTTGFKLDTLARAPLWSAGLDYKHGTGHGVGACLNVHEGPQSISPRITSHRAALEPGMIVSNEPGYYEEGDNGFGIRIENLLYVVEKHSGYDDKYLGFDRLTFVPIDRRLINRNLLTRPEEEWLDSYHAECWDKVSPLVPDDVRSWLRKMTQPMGTALKTRSSGAKTP